MSKVRVGVGPLCRWVDDWVRGPIRRVREFGRVSGVSYQRGLRDLSN